MRLPPSFFGRVSLYGVELALALLVTSMVLGDIIFGRIAMGVLLMASIAYWWDERRSRLDRLSAVRRARFRRRLLESKRVV